MANPTDPAASRFRTELDDGQIVEIDGSTIRDQESGSARPAVLLRMGPERAHVLAHVLSEWARTALIYATLRSSERTERTLSLALEAGASAAGDLGALECATRIPGVPSPQQRVAAVTVLREREPRITPLQRIAVIDAAARWLAEDAGEDLAQALLEAVCVEPLSANFAYIALIEQPGAAQ